MVSMINRKRKIWCWKSTKNSCEKNF